MYSDAISRDMNSLLFSSTFKHPSEGEFAKIKQLISSDSGPNYHHQSSLHQQPPPPASQQQQSSLLRYRSAPSSFFADSFDGDDVSGCEDFLNSPVPSERVFSDGSRESSGFPAILKQEERDSFAPPPQSQQDHVMYGNNSRAVDLPNHSSGFNMEGSFRAGNSPASSNLIRQSSSPAGFFSSLNVENGLAVMGDVGTTSSSSRLNNNINFSTGPSTSRFMPQIAENGHETISIGNLENGHLVNGNDTNKGYDPSTRNDSWNNLSFNNLKRDMNGDLKMYSGLNGFDTQNGGDSKGYTPSLVHQLSLPKTSTEMAAVEKFLQFQQESVPCKIRAKRGHATHPRSIAERMRRNRISDRMKILQELFPEMDKQANTADMLDLAVEFIKDLKKEVQTLTDTRARCTCSRTKKLSMATE